MANTKSAKKAYLQSEKRRKANLARVSAMKTAVKKLITALESNNIEQYDVLLRSVASQFGRARSKKVVKAGTASRTLSRLSRRVASKQRAASGSSL